MASAAGGVVLTSVNMTELEETWSPEPVKAWRYWYVGPLEWDFGEHRWKVQIAGDVEVWDSPLKLAGHHLAVAPGSVLEVIDHAAPHADCRCGINAVKALDFHELQHRTGQICECYWQQDVVMHGGRPVPQVIAVSQVELAGVVDEYEGGYRAQQATIIGPMTVIGGTPRIAEVLSENYGIEVRAESYDGPLSIQLAKEYESGHREADTPDHRGTGTGQDTGTSKRTSKGWRIVRQGAKQLGVVVGVFAIFLCILLLIGLGGTAIAEWINGTESDALCVDTANRTGGTAQELDTFGACRVLLPSGLIIDADDIHWADEAQ